MRSLLAICLALGLTACAYGRRIVVLPKRGLIIEYVEPAEVERLCGMPAACCVFEDEGAFDRIVKSPGVACHLHELCHPEVEGLSRTEEEELCDYLEDLIQEGNDG